MQLDEYRVARSESGIALNGRKSKGRGVLRSVLLVATICSSTLVNTQHHARNLKERLGPLDLFSISIASYHPRRNE